MPFRCGRRKARNIYFGPGEASDDDYEVAKADTPQASMLIVQALNEYLWGINPDRIVESMNLKKEDS